MTWGLFWFLNHNNYRYFPVARDVSKGCFYEIAFLLFRFVKIYLAVFSGHQVNVAFFRNCRISQDSCFSVLGFKFSASSFANS